MHHHRHLRRGQSPLKMPGHSHHFCGEPPVSKDFRPVVSHQDYYGAANSHIKESRRRLVNQNYGDGKQDPAKKCCSDKVAAESGCFMNAEDAQKVGLANPLRATFVWDLVNATGTQLSEIGMCHEAGVFTRKYCKNGQNQPCKKNTVVCTKKTLVTANKLKTLEKRLAWVEEYLINTFTIRSVQDTIEINPSTLGDYHDSNGDLPPYFKLNYNNTDLVIIMTMDPPASTGVAGFAYCVQQDQWGRCTVGVFNWVATTITDNPIIANAPNVIASERSTALHETMHILGLKRQNSNQASLFRDKWGCQRPDSFLFEDAKQSDGTDEDGFITKEVRHWKTPLVLQVARQQFGCKTLKGVPMEDVKLGWLAHWEARVMGPDVMSYGIGVGETYVSDITLAFFVDSGQYLSNFTCGSAKSCGGGRLLESTGEDEELAQRSFSSSLFASDKENTDQKDDAVKVDNLTLSSPGHIRWGRNQGCDFVQKKPTMSNWGSRYVCDKPQTYGCTPDNKMSSACLLFDYGTDEMGKTNAATNFPCPPSNTGADCTPRNNEGLPPDYTYFTGEQATTGGHSESMDYAPVRVGYWNCMDTKPELSGAIKGMEGQSVDYGEAFDALETSIPDFGGQIRSSRSRCFRSSLTAFSELINFNPAFPEYGLCYAANCYKKDYLQFGIKGVGGIKWYGCGTDESTKIYIPGFFGAFFCPNVTAFCEMETISGKFYTENNETFEWIVWGVVLGVLLILFIVFCCVKPARQNCAKCIKSSVGFDQPSKHAQPNKTKCELCLPKALMALCVIWDIIGLGLVIMSVLILAAPTMFWESASRQVYHVLAIGIITAILASFGFAGARSTRPTLKICFYFYIVICVLIALLLMVVCAFALKPLVEVVLESAWDNLRVQFPAEMTGMDAKRATEHIESEISNYAGIIWPVIIFIWLSVVGGIVMAGFLLTCKNITGTMGFFTNILLLGLGVVFLVTGSFVSQILSLTEKLWAYTIPILLPGIFMLTIGFLGNFHLFPCIVTSGKICVMYIHLSFAGCATVALITFGIYFLVNASNIGERIRELDDEELGSLLQGMKVGGTWNAENTKTLLTEGFRTFGMLCIMVSLLVIFTIITGSYLLIKTKRRFHKDKTEQAARKMALSGRYLADGHAEWLQGDAMEPVHEPFAAVDQPYNQQLEMHNFADVPVAKIVGDRL